MKKLGVLILGLGLLLLAACGSGAEENGAGGDSGDTAEGESVTLS